MSPKTTFPSLRVLLSFSILFWLSSIISLHIISWYLGVPDFFFHKKTDTFLIVSHIVGSGICMFLMTWLIYRKATQNCMEFTTITLLMLLEIHCLFGFNGLSSPRPSSPFSPFMMLFFFGAIFSIIFFFPLMYLIHKAVLILAQNAYLYFAKREQK